MKKIISLLMIGILISGFLLISKDNVTVVLREKHIAFLKESPFQKTLKLTKEERKARSLPPNKYFEREWELTMNPATGEPEPQKVLELQAKLSKSTISRKSPGDAVDNPWIERGPNNVGGRTRALLFDPNDSNNKRVFAGGVSGGLWVNNDITNPNSTWSQMTNVPGNLSVSCIAVDPNNTNIFYIGTGELYTAGTVTGNGVYKSIDGGINWVSIFGGEQGVTTGGTFKTVSGHYFIQDVIVRNNGGVSEVFIGVGASFWRYGGALTTFLGRPIDYGVFKSIDSGANWTRPTFPEINGNRQQPNDFELSADNTLWLTTTRNYYSDAGGAILKFTSGNTFTQVMQIPNVYRTELAFSATNPSKAYILAEATNRKPVIYKTADAFASNPTVVSLPADSDDGIDSDDFANKQADYNLMIEVDPNNDAILYVGGINLFRSVNSGATWDQISRRHFTKPGSYSEVHADQHAMSFRPNDSDQAVFGNDGGVYFASSLVSANTSGSSLKAMNTGYNVTQFYRGAIAPTVAEEYFIGGTQDNGTQSFYMPRKNISSSVEINGGDGAYCFVDQVGELYMIVSYVYNNSYDLLDFRDGKRKTINLDTGNDGDFINPADLDSNLDILYTSGSKDGDYRVFRYSNLLAISSDGTATKDTLRNNLLNAWTTAMKISPFTTTSTTLLIGTETGKLLRATNINANATWLDITGSQFLGSISDIEYGANENEILVTFHNYGVSNVWFSADGGVSWANKEGNLPDLPVKTILQNPINNNEVIVGTDLGTWKTSNFNENAPNWEQTYNGMSDVKVTDLQLRAEDNTILATTFGRGVFTGKFSADDLKTTNLNDSKTIVIFPTITSRIINITTSEKMEPVTLLIYDSTGKNVFVKEKITLFESKNNSVELQLVEGVYVVKILKGNHILKTQRIIVRK